MGMGLLSEKRSNPKSSITAVITVRGKRTAGILPRNPLGNAIFAATVAAAAAAYLLPHAPPMECPWNSSRSAGRYATSSAATTAAVSLLPYVDIPKMTHSLAPPGPAL